MRRPNRSDGGSLPKRARVVARCALSWRGAMRHWTSLKRGFEVFGSMPLGVDLFCLLVKQSHQKLGGAIFIEVELSGNSDSACHVVRFQVQSD